MVRTDMDADKLLRLREASLKDENPLVDQLKMNGYEAGTIAVRHQERDGDVWFAEPLANGRSTVEMQVSRTHTSFSYSARKVDKFQGDYVVLGCLSRDLKTEELMRLKPEQYPMIWVWLERPEFHELLATKERNKGKDGKSDYYIVSPGELKDLGFLVAGDDLVQLTVRFKDGMSRPDRNVVFKKDLS